jgi:hypothetical protein
VEPGEPLVGFAGGAFAALLAFFRVNMLMVILGAIGVVAAVKVMIG